MSARSRETPWDGALLVNLAAAPFVNQRPVQRFKLAAWVAGALLAAVNILLLLQYRHDSTTLRARLAETRSAIEARSRSVVETATELRGLGLAAQNAQVDFLNRRIAERTFPWSLLFQRIAATLPDGVRLINLTPVFTKREGRAGRAAPPTLPEDELVDLNIRGVAKSDEELYELIDAFFSSPAFERPRLYHESRASGEVQFTVDVQYRPRLEPPPPQTPMGQPEASHQPAVAAEPAEPVAEPESEDPVAAEPEEVVAGPDEVSG